MPSLTKGLAAAAYWIEKPYDWTKAQLRKKMGRRDPVHIVPYRGHGTPHEVLLKGRVLEDEGIRRADAGATRWQNLVNSYKRFETDEVPGARLRAWIAGPEGQDTAQEVTTDDEGYFDVHLRPTWGLSGDRLWHDVELELLGDWAEADRLRATGTVLVPPPEARFGIISDMDDTVLQTGATDFWGMVRRTVFEDVHARLPFEGVAAFYRALQRGPDNGLDGDVRNPIFYVSSSPWNLYSLLTEFLDLHNVPPGPIFLRDLGVDRDKFIKAGHHEHKLEQIEGLLGLYPDLPFILIGDSGQEDPEIYRQAVADFPGRIRAIYIRDVTTPERDEEVHALAEEVERAGVPMRLVKDTVAATEHAIESGFIAEGAVPDVRAAKARGN